MLGTWGMLPDFQHFEGIEGVLELWDKIRKSDKRFIYSLESTSNQATNWFVQCANLWY
jgi:hypothetical protein